MSFPLRALAIVAIVACAGCAHVEPGRDVLRSMDVEGNETLSASEIEARLALSPTPFWPWADARYYDQGTLTGDRRRLLRYYQANGFYEARVKSRVRREDGDAHVTFEVEEGPATKVAKVELKGLEALPAEVHEAVLRERLPLREGERITEAAWDATRNALEQRLRDHGYADAKVEGTVEVDVRRRVATAVAEVTPGPRLRFGRTVLTGAVAVSRETILESVRADIPDGSQYSEARLAEAEANLMAMGVFGGVRVSRGPTNEDGTVPVMVAVREAPFRTVRLGVGAGIDTGSFTARATGELEHRNFFGGLRKLRWENELGYSLLRNGAEIVDHGVVGSSALDFTQPDLIRRLDANLRAEYEHDLALTYTWDAVKGRVGFPIRLTRNLTLTPSYNIHRYWLESDVLGSGGNCSQAQGDCVLGYVEERLAWDMRDHPLNTRSGWYASLSLQQGRDWLGSWTHYDRALAEVRYFQPLPWKWVLALRVQGGALLPKQAAPGESQTLSPIMERFYAGGANSVRGYNYQRLAPLQQVSTPGQAQRPLDQLTEEDTLPIGGDALLEGSAELRIPVVGDLGLALFVDAGNVARFAREDVGELLQPNVAVGAGLRYMTPFGPVRFDAGWLAVKNEPCVVTADGGCTQADLGTSPFALHFTIGEAF